MKVLRLLRGFGSRGRRNQLCKSSFLALVFNSIVAAGRFVWQWLPALGQSGGILVGDRIDVFYLVAFDSGSFFASMVLCQLDIERRWEVVLVYGLVDHARSPSFLDELFLNISMINTQFI